MTITVIVPVYNAESFVSRAVNSVLLLGEVTELILVDDGSTDKSLEICQKLAKSDCRIKVLTHPNNLNKGVSATRNLGIKHASSIYLAFLDADDYYLPNRFKNVKEVLSRMADIDGMYEMIGFHDSQNVIQKYSTLHIVKPEKLFENLSPLGDSLWFHIDGLTVKKTIFLKSGYFDESLLTLEDTFQWFKFSITSNLIAGDICNPVAIKQRSMNSLSSNRMQVKNDTTLMWLKLYVWCNKQKLEEARKILLLKKIFNYAYHELKGYNRLRFIMSIIRTNPSYVFANYFFVRN